MWQRKNSIRKQKLRQIGNEEDKQKTSPGK